MRGLASFPKTSDSTLPERTGSPSMSISDWRPLDRNTLRASFTLTTPSGMVIHDCTYHTKDDSRWIGLPSRSYEKDGVRKWVPLVGVHRPRHGEQVHGSGLCRH